MSNPAHADDAQGQITVTSSIKEPPQATQACGGSFMSFTEIDSVS